MAEYTVTSCIWECGKCVSIDSSTRRLVYHATNSYPQDYHANVLTGCYWIFDRFFFKIGIWQWLDPYWLIAVQVLLTLAFMTQCCVVLILILYHLLFGHPAAESTMAMGGQFFSAVLLTISVFIFGIMSQDRAWMQRPDQNFLSWSFGFAVLAAISSYISAGFLYCVSYTDRAAQEEVEKYEAVEQHYGLPSVLSGGAGSAFGRSLYGGTQSVGGVVVKVPSMGARPEQVLTLGSDLRRLDGGDGSASLFTPSVAYHPAHNVPLSTLHEDSRGGISGDIDSGRNPLLKSPIESPIASTYGSERSEQSLYANQQMGGIEPRGRTNGSRYPTSVQSQSYSPLHEQQQEDDYSREGMRDYPSQAPYSRGAPNAMRRPKY